MGPTLTAPCEWSFWPTQRFSPWPPPFAGAPCLQPDEREHDGNARDVDDAEGWELHLATAVGGLYIATHRGVQLGVGLASDAVRHQGRGHG